MTTTKPNADARTLTPWQVAELVAEESDDSSWEIKLADKARFRYEGGSE
jgi:hypothetical protein